MGVEKKFPEGVIAGDICEHLKEKIKFLPEASCETVIDKIYGCFESKCPAPAPNYTAQTRMASSLPSGLKQELERLACDFIEKKFPEGVVAADICEHLKGRSSFFQKLLARLLWTRSMDSSSRSALRVLQTP